ncbi:MAG: 1-deoxy-D-xylulose-5-phosphate reductoisomerase [candidate division WOR-3 bacterium]|nr:1-deoxy-D-xylulose-5-phosphate reductoisomerase [candidate division WOR-3 bacterium]
MKKVLLLGATGSIGTSTLKVIRQYSDKFKIAGISANTSIDEIKKIKEEFGVEYSGINQSGSVETGGSELTVSDVNVYLAKNTDYDIMVNALVGSAGFPATYEAIKRGKDIALANKETIVAYGMIINSMLEQYPGARIMPIDSEHSALWQLIEGFKENALDHIIITASGGVPFRKNTMDLEKDDILNHPVWDMGSKVTVDSSTMMNKGLEVIEASYLFNLPAEKIEVLIHPQSIVHGISVFSDGSSAAHMAYPDMVLPIQYAMLYPDISNIQMIKKLDLAKDGPLEFFRVAGKQKRAIELAYYCLEKGGTYTAVYSAANEAAVERFVSGDIRFNQITDIVEKTVNMHNPPEECTIDSIIQSEEKARQTAGLVEV